MEEIMNNNEASGTVPLNNSEPLYKTQQNSIVPQPSLEIKEDEGKKGKRSVFITFVASLLLAILVIGGIALNWNFFRLLFVSLIKTSDNSQLTTKSVAKPTEASEPTISLGTQTLKVIPGQTSPGEYTLADGETTILFGSNSVPDLVFGKYYSLNDIHNINYLPIRDEVSFYNKGFLISLKNQGCKTENRFTDVPEVWVTDCSIQVTSIKENAPTKQLDAFNRAFVTNVSYSGVITQTDNPLIYITVPKLSIQNFSTPHSSENVSLETNSMTSYSTSTFWDIQIVTSFGIETIRYSAQEVWDKETKEVVIGPLTSVSTINSLDCKVIYTGNEGQKTEQCGVTVNISFSQNKTNLIPVKLSTYSQ